MKGKKIHLFLGLILSAGLILSCQKELELTPPPEVKIGTKWKYTYSSYYLSGQLRDQYDIIYRVLSEESYGGEIWFNVTDSASTTVFLLNKKTGGLYQYANATSNLFCKDPAAPGDTYTTYNNGGTELFNVINVKDTIPLTVGNVPANYYEGIKGGRIIDKIWYNDKMWILQKILYAVSGGGIYYKVNSISLKEITY